MGGAGRVLLVCGMPGAGKTTLARLLVAERGAVLLSPDDWLLALDLDPLDPRLRRAVERRLWDHAVELGSRGLTVVADFGFWTRPDRRRARDRARAAGLAVELHALDVPLAERQRRVALRNAEPGAVTVTAAALAGWERWWQPPDEAERASYDAAPGGPG
ncbi:AAA family ATPase [Nocardioides litoris]|uniref:AAA family ATPase n=1 Tax=Nocardioides litoris TaxID=1926648 RepID=UPI00111FC96C|nr:ATP-binding protein [Nocardioides litoris]